MERINENEFFKKCSYRNCDNIISDVKRSNSKYCCRACKDNEKIYVKRHKRMIEKSFNEQNELVKLVKIIKNNL